MGYIDPTGDWLAMTITWRAAMKAAGMSWTKEQTDAFDAVFRTLTVVGSGARSITVTLPATQGFAQSDTLIDQTPIACFIGGTLVTYDFTDADVYNEAAGRHELGQTFYSGTEITYIY